MVRYFRHARWRDRASFSFVLVERLAIGVPLSAIYEPIGRPLAGLEWKFEFFQLLSSKKFFVRLLGKIRILNFSLKNFVKKKYKMKIIFQFISQNWYFFLNKLYNNPIILLIYPIIQFFFQFPNLEREMPLHKSSLRRRKNSVNRVLETRFTKISEEKRVWRGRRKRGSRF